MGSSRMSAGVKEDVPPLLEGREEDEDMPPLFEGRGRRKQCDVEMWNICGDCASADEERLWQQWGLQWTADTVGLVAASLGIIL